MAKQEQKVIEKILFDQNEYSQKENKKVTVIGIEQKITLNNLYHYLLPHLCGTGGNYKEWQKQKQLGEYTLNNISPINGNNMRGTDYVSQYNLNVDELKSSEVDDSKLIIPLHVDRTRYETHEELFAAIINWWTKIKGRSESTIRGRIRYARSMVKHPIFPVDWFKFEPEQIINQLLYRQNYEYKEIAKEKGNPTYGSTQLINLWKTVRTFSQAYGLDISHWGYNPPPEPEPQIKIVPRPMTVNRLIHHRYSNDRFENSLIRTILTLGFHTGLRPGELITLKVEDIYFDEGYIIIREQKKKFRERQIWIDDPVMTSRQQNSLRNWINIWRPRRKTELSENILFIQKDGKPFPSEDALRMYLSPFCKPVWKDFKPKIMRDWSAIARLIRTKIETKKWDTRVVKNELGHKFVNTTESYIQYAENYYRKDPYDWLRAALKFHKDSKRMKRLMKQALGPSQKTSKILTNGKKGFIEVKITPVENNGPDGI